MSGVTHRVCYPLLHTDCGRRMTLWSKRCQHAHPTIPALIECNHRRIPSPSAELNDGYTDSGFRGSVVYASSPRQAPLPAHASSTYSAQQTCQMHSTTRWCYRRQSTHRTINLWRRSARATILYPTAQMLYLAFQSMEARADSAPVASGETLDDVVRFLRSFQWRRTVPSFRSNVA
jgi:hypothetical protein